LISKEKKEKPTERKPIATRIRPQTLRPFFSASIVHGDDMERLRDRALLLVRNIGPVMMLAVSSHGFRTATSQAKLHDGDGLPRALLSSLAVPDGDWRGSRD
jgi:hypothetical protein